MYFDETAWVAIAFLLFFVLVWKKGKKAILSLLDERSSLIEKELKEDILFAKFIKETSEELEKLYSLEKDKAEKQKILDNARNHWLRKKTTRYKNFVSKMNNASILAQKVYLKEPELFLELYKASGSSMEVFVSELKNLAKNTKDNPYEKLQMLVDEKMRSL